MSDLRSFIVLQARLYEFLEQQDEVTLLAIADGTAQLAVLRGDEGYAPMRSASREDARATSRLMVGRTAPRSSDPSPVAGDLSQMASEHERRTYLDDPRLTVAVLHGVARLWRLRRYSKLRRDQLIDLLARHDLPSTSAPADEARPLDSISPDVVDENGGAGHRTAPDETPPKAAQSIETVRPNSDVAGIALHLREIETEDEGASYLRALDLDKESLLAVAAELLLTRVDRLSRKELERRVLKQAIGARRKFSGLRNW